MKSSLSMNSHHILNKAEWISWAGYFGKIIANMFRQCPPDSATFGRNQYIKMTMIFISLFSLSVFLLKCNSEMQMLKANVTLKFQHYQHTIEEFINCFFNVNMMYHWVVKYLPVFIVSTFWVICSSVLRHCKNIFMSAKNTVQ